MDHTLSISVSLTSDWLPVWCVGNKSEENQLTSVNVSCIRFQAAWRDPFARNPPPLPVEFSPSNNLTSFLLRFAARDCLDTDPFDGIASCFGWIDTLLLLSKFFLIEFVSGSWQDVARVVVVVVVMQEKSLPLSPFQFLDPNSVSDRWPLPWTVIFRPGKHSAPIQLPSRRNSSLGSSSDNDRLLRRSRLNFFSPVTSTANVDLWDLQEMDTTTREHG